MDGNVVLDIVHHLDDDAVALPGDYLGAGELAVHRRDGAGGAQPCHILNRHLPHMIETADNRHVNSRRFSKTSFIDGRTDRQELAKALHKKTRSNIGETRCFFIKKRNRHPS